MVSGPKQIPLDKLIKFKVSILLVMDDGLWAIQFLTSAACVRMVSILLVMDDGLWGIIVKVKELEGKRLNPSCNG